MQALPSVKLCEPFFMYTYVSLSVVIPVYAACKLFVVRTAIDGVNEAIVNGDPQQLLFSLQSEDTRLNAILPENVQWYMDVLSKAIKDKAEVQYTLCVFAHR